MSRVATPGGSVASKAVEFIHTLPTCTLHIMHDRSVPGEHSEEASCYQCGLPPGWLVPVDLPQLPRHQGVPGEPRQIPAGHQRVCRAHLW